jgi:hypothetical protein
MPRTILAAIAALTAPAALVAPGCSLLPWGNNDVSITAPNPEVPPIRLDQTGGAGGRHLVVMQVPTGGWTVTIDRAEVTPDGRRIFVTARRPDPAFMHTQAFVELRALSEVPVDTRVEVVARVLDRHQRTDSQVYSRVEPVAAFEF